MTPTHHRPRWLERHWRPAILAALAILAVASGYAIRTSYHAALGHVHTGQLEACQRGNVLRARLQVNVQVLDALLAASDRAVAVTYEHLQDLTQPVPTVNCQAVVPKP